MGSYNFHRVSHAYMIIAIPDQLCSGVDFDDEELPFLEENKSEIKVGVPLKM